MRKYYDDFNEDYEKGFEDGRKEFLEESNNDILSEEEVKDIIYETAKKYGLAVKSNKHYNYYYVRIYVRDEKFGGIEIRYDIANDVPLKKWDKNNSRHTNPELKLAIEGYLEQKDDKTLRDFELLAKQLNPLLKFWKELESMRLRFYKNQ